MSKILKVRNVNDYARYVGCSEQHPLVCVIDYAEVSPVRHSLNDYGVYGIFFHDEAEIDLAYGCGKYDYKKGTVICVAPGQVGGKEDNGEEVMLTGWALLFHPDLLHGFPLEKRIREYSFFDYRINEALHMTEEEHDILASLMRQIREELGKKPDELQRAILIGYIELALNFCQRFYNRQFVTRKIENSDILVRFDRLLRDYFEDSLQYTLGLPTVQYCADKSSLPRTGWRQERPSPKCQTASASNIPSTSAGCSRSRRGLRRRNIVRGCGADRLHVDDHNVIQSGLSKKALLPLSLQLNQVAFRMKTEYEKCLAGEPFIGSRDPKIVETILRTRRLLAQFNATDYADTERKQALLREMFGSMGKGVHVDIDILISIANTESIFLSETK